MNNDDNALNELRTLNLSSPHYSGLWIKWDFEVQGYRWIGPNRSILRGIRGHENRDFVKMRERRRTMKSEVL